MIRALKWFMVFLVTVVLLSALLALGISAGLADSMGHVNIEVDGAPVTLARHGGAWLACTAGLVVVMLAVFIVLPLAVLLPLLLVVLLVCAVFAGLAALLFSPLLLVGALVWLIWRIARGPKRSAGATMAR